jgi:cell division septation protein DedD
VTIGQSGNLIWTEIGPFPHTPETGRVRELIDGTPTVLASGLSNTLDLKVASDDTIYVLTLGDADETGEAPGIPFTGKLATVEADGTLSVVAEGFMFATSFEVCDGDAYITGLTGDTRIVEDYETLEPLPEPTATPTTAPTQVPTTAPTTAPTAAPTSTTVPGPPATGTGTTGDSGAFMWLLAAAGLFAIAGGLTITSVSRRKA